MSTSFAASQNTVQGDILEDIELIENLEQTKRTAVDIEEKVKLAKQTEVSSRANFVQRIHRKLKKECLAHVIGMP